MSTTRVGACLAADGGDGTIVGQLGGARSLADMTLEAGRSQRGWPSAFVIDPLGKVVTLVKREPR